MEMLRTKIPQVGSQVTSLAMLDNRRMVGGGSSDSSGNGNSRNRSSSRDKPPQLPPRDNGIYRAIWSNNSQNHDKKEKKKQPGDDPYYFGLSARIPNFVKSRKKKQKERSRMMAGHGQNPADISGSAPNSLPSHPFWWHTRIYPDNMGCRGEPRPASPTSMMPYVTDSSDSDYSHIYGRLPIPTRGLRKFPTKPLFLSQ